MDGVFDWIDYLLLVSVTPKNMKKTENQHKNFKKINHSLGNVLIVILYTT